MVPNSNLCGFRRIFGLLKVLVYCYLKWNIKFILKEQNTSNLQFSETQRTQLKGYSLGKAQMSQG